jgi:hypothetical protein
MADTGWRPSRAWCEDQLAVAEEIAGNTLSATRREGWRVTVWIEDGRVRLKLED